ncbi:hypothetical protein OQI89_08815 [Lentilactobacillus diolivorans]|uniref:hypothetical protein n=1 Tax=Lentilactobacillus diolivorans TaxID=179838 RepID=UPI0024696463|nr:hypothetical protein [Lentilactobacillus diolivorans]MDH5105950.1 hypothetical protein [Lentilactobacillus diolivorans]
MAGVCLLAHVSAKYKVQRDIPDFGILSQGAYMAGVCLLAHVSAKYKVQRDIPGFGILSQRAYMAGVCLLAHVSASEFSLYTAGSYLLP